MKKILKLLIPVIALLVGGAGGHFLKPAPKVSPKGENVAAGEGHGEGAETAEEKGKEGAGKNGGMKKNAEWFNFSNQFFIPLVRNGDSDALIIMTVSLETTAEQLEEIGRQESRLRDLLLRRLLVIANSGGFDGNFTTEGRFRKLRAELLDAMHDSVGKTAITDVLITDIARSAS